MGRLKETRKFIQVIIGPRQVGKSTVVRQVLQELNAPYLFYAADYYPAINGNWILDTWEAARRQMQLNGYEELVLVIDEIQKVANWSEAVKKAWDQDTFNDVNIKVLLLGSSRVLIEKGLTESLAGRFEEIRMGHWSYKEMKDCFGWTLNQYIYFGGYPGAASLIEDEDRYMQYIQSSIIDTTINKDILIDSPISKPALLRQTFELGSAYSGQILSLNKMLGSLQDAGNTSTLMGYLNLLDECGMLVGLQKYSVDFARRKASIPKLQVYNNALKTAYTTMTFSQAIMDRAAWGHIFESCIGAYIVNQSFVHQFKVYYWRERNDEVDFILKKNGVIVAIEVKSNAEKSSKGLSVFTQEFKPQHSFIVGEGGIPADEFLSCDLSLLFK